MKITTAIDAKDNIRTHKVIGMLTKALLLEKLREIYADAGFQPNMNALWDFNSADMTAFSLQDTEDIANFVLANWIPTNRIKSALIASEVFNNRLSQSYAKQFHNHAYKCVKVFKTSEEARAWLKQE